MFSAVQAQSASLNVSKGANASAGFGAARRGQADGEPRPRATGAAGFGGVSARADGGGSAPVQTAKAGFGAVEARQAEVAAAPASAVRRSNFEPVRILAKPDPIYTAEAREMRLEGDVAVEALFTADGRIEEIRVIRGLGHGLDEAAVAAIKAIEFEPARRAGAPEDARLRLTVRFQIAF